MLHRIRFYDVKEQQVELCFTEEVGILVDKMSENLSS